MKCAVIGLGEVGSRYAVALAAAGHAVVGFDPAATSQDEPYATAASPQEAVAGADLVLVMTSAGVAPLIVDETIVHLMPGSIYADFSSASPDVMVELGGRVDAAGAHFVDVALLGAVSIQAARTPLMLAGSHAIAAGEVFATLGAEIEVLPDSLPGQAMAHKLLRSVFMKGLAAVICEAMEAAEAADCVDWTRQQIASHLGEEGNQMIDHLRRGSQLHAVRRAQEMRDTASYLVDLGVPNTMSTAAAQYLEGLANRSEVGGS